MSDIVRQEIETEAEGASPFFNSRGTWDDAESYVIMSAPTRHTQIKEHKLISSWRVLKRGEFSAKTAHKNHKLVKKDSRRKRKMLHKKKPVDGDRGSSTKLKKFPFIRKNYFPLF